MNALKLRLVVDSNILFAAVIKEETSVRLLLISVNLLPAKRGKTDDLMAVEGELRKIEHTMAEISKKLDDLLENRETLALMTISERSLKDFLLKEPDLYSMKDVKARY